MDKRHTYLTQGFFFRHRLLKTLRNAKALLLESPALNEYMTEIPLKEFLIENGAIFATHQNGKRLSVENLGPIMMIYPFEMSVKNLNPEVFYRRSILASRRIKIDLL